MLGPFVHVIDDDQAVQNSIGFLLYRAGIPNRIYASAETFLGTLPSITTGCVVTDVQLPGMTGLELLNLLKRSGKVISTVVITGYWDASIAADAMMLGAHDCMAKPLDAKMLLAAIRAAGDGVARSDSQVRKRRF